MITQCIRNAVIKSVESFWWPKIQLGDISNILSSPDFSFLFFFFMLDYSKTCYQPGLVFPVKTVLPFISQSLWYQSSSVALMTSLESFPPPKNHSRSKNVMFDPLIIVQSLRASDFGFSLAFVCSFWKKKNAVLNKKKDLGKSTSEMHNKSKGGEHLAE